MALDTDDLAKLQMAVLQDRPLSTTGLRQTAEVKRVFAELQDEFNNAPEGVMVEIVADIDFGKYDTLIAATEKAWGKLY